MEFKLEEFDFFIRFSYDLVDLPYCLIIALFAQLIVLKVKPMSLGQTVQQKRGYKAKE